MYRFKFADFNLQISGQQQCSNQHCPFSEWDALKNPSLPGLNHRPSAYIPNALKRVIHAILDNGTHVSNHLYNLREEEGLN
jgi:hypothetical protein